MIKKDHKTSEEQKLLEKKIQEKTQAPEEMLKSETNEIIQEQAVTTCLETLKMYMDIDLTQQENVLNQFKMIDQKQLIKKNGEDTVLNINGTINGKKMTLWYNLTT